MLTQAIAGHHMRAVRLEPGDTKRLLGVHVSGLSGATAVKHPGKQVCQL